MSKSSLRERYAAGLMLRGERLVKRTFKFDVYSRSKTPGVHYYLGRAGSLRVGRTVAGSIPCSQHFKDLLLNGGRPLPEGVTAVSLEDPAAMHNAIAQAVGEKS